ncbi:MAG: ParA family protein [Planctomycetota bacterium]
MPQIIAAAGLSTGAGRTTSVLNLSYGLALAGSPVLVIDLSRDGRITERLGMPALRRGQVAALLAGDPEAASLGVVIRTADVGLDVVPADPKTREVQRIDEAHLSRAIEDLEVVYDVVLVDCPGDRGTLDAAVFRVADRVLLHISPSALEPDSRPELSAWIDAYRATRRESGKESHRIDLVVIGEESRPAIDERTLIDLVGSPERVHVIPWDDEVGEEDARKSLFEGERVASPLAWAYGLLAKELVSGE